MSMKTYHGSCHCGNVKYEATFDPAEGSGKCNCTFCFKSRNWGFFVKPENFKLLTPESELTDYARNGMVHHLFCKTCGVRSYSWSDIPEAGGFKYGVAVTCLDDITQDEIASAPIKYADGLHNNWWNTPEDTRNL